MEEIIRRIYRFKGSVQGVGFRYHAMTYARALGLTGFVRNEEDGSVYLEVQGTFDRMGELLGKLYQTKYIRITDIEAEEIPLKKGETKFQISGYDFF